MHRWFSGTVLTCLVWSSPAWCRSDDKSAAEPILDDQTQIAGSVHFDRLDVPKIFAQLRKFVGDDAFDRRMESELAGHLSAIKSAGIVEIHFALSLEDFPNAGPVIGFRLKPNADRRAATNLISSLFPQGDRRAAPSPRDPSMMVWENDLQRRRLADQRSDRPALKAAFSGTTKAAVVVVGVPTADTKKVASEMFPALPPPFGPEAGKVISRSLEWVRLSLGFGDPGFFLTGEIDSKTPEDAKALGDMVAEAIRALPALVGDNPAGAAAAKLAGRIAVKANGHRVTLQLTDEAMQAGAGELASLVASARQSAARSETMNSLKQMALAMHIHLDAHSAFPAAAIRSPDGKPLLSWRVAVLPYLDQNELYKQFKLDEPWDSEHNRRLIAKMPQVFRHPLSKAAGQGKTCFLGVGGERGLVSANPVKIQDITDGTSCTVMIVEVDDAKAVIWTKPDDLIVEAGKPIEGLGGHFRNVFLAAFVDGSVRALETKMPQEKLMAYFTRNGGETIND